MWDKVIKLFVDVFASTPDFCISFFSVASSGYSVHVATNENNIVNYYAILNYEGNLILALLFPLIRLFSRFPHGNGIICKTERDH